jgi:hypothetical protein
MPTDADTLLASLQLWTRNRGSFTHGLSSLMSLSKWFSHLSGGQVHSHGLMGCGKLKAVFVPLEDRDDQFSMEDEERCLDLLQ